MKNVKERRNGWNEVGRQLRSRRHDLRRFGGNVFGSAFVIGRARESLPSFPGHGAPRREPRYVINDDRSRWPVTRRTRTEARVL